MRKKNSPADAKHYLITEIDLTDFKNENLITNIRRNKAEKPYFLKNIFQKNLKPRKHQIK